MRIRKPALARCSSGQALVETALLLPLLLTIILNAVNFGYFFVVALNLAAAPRSGVEYSILGGATAGGSALGLPPAGPASTNTTVSYLTYQDMAGALSSSSSTPLQVCSKVIGLNGSGSSQTAKCATFGTYPSPPSPDSDPESPSFVLNRVDVKYTFNTLIPGTVFNLALLPLAICSGGTCTFHRQASMRALD